MTSARNFCFAISAFAVACGGSSGDVAAQRTSDASASPPDAAGAGQEIDGGAAMDPASPSDAALDATSNPSPDARAGTSSRLKHVVVIVKENHTFDNYFGSFPGADGTTQCLTSTGMITCPRAPDRTPRDMCHEHACALTDWDQGKMDGWDSVTGTSQSGDNLAYAQYREADIPNYWAYAKAFSLADHFHAAMLGPSFPGHMMFLAAQAGWATGNPNTDIVHPYWGCDQSPTTQVSILDNGTCATKSIFPCFTIPSLPDVLPSGVDWKFYGSNFYLLPEVWSMFDGISGVRNGPGWSNVVNTTQFDSDIDAGHLPAVSWLVNQDLADEHPAVGGVCAGENWTVQRLNKLMASSYWNDTVVFFTMDDFGGWYDHVAPPRQYGCDPQHPYGLGFRLPLIIMSPYVKPHTVFHEVSEQASIPRFIEEVFHATMHLSDLDPAAQDGQANDLMNAFDFTQAPNPPLMLTTRACL